MNIYRVTMQTYGENPIIVHDEYYTEKATATARFEEHVNGMTNDRYKDGFECKAFDFKAGTLIWRYTMPNHYIVDLRTIDVITAQKGKED